MKKTFPAALTFVLFVVSSSVLAQPGTLDSSFGVNGKLTSNLASVGDFSIYNEPIAIQADGKIVIATSLESAPNQRHFLVVRYNSNGDLDSAFGINGAVHTFFD